MPIKPFMPAPDAGWNNGRDISSNFNERNTMKSITTLGHELCIDNFAAQNAASASVNKAHELDLAWTWATISWPACYEDVYALRDALENKQSEIYDRCPAAFATSCKS